MPTTTELAQQFRAAVDRQDAVALGRLASAYSQLYQRMEGKLDSLLLKVSTIDAPTQGQVYRLAQYKNLVNSLETELTKYGAYVETEIQTNSQEAVDLAVKQTAEYLRAAGYSMPNMLPTRTIYNMLGFLQEDSPLYKRIGELAPYHTQRVADSLLEGVAFGYNPAKTAKMFETVMGGGLTDAMRMSRTAQLYASREASRASYIANSDVIEGWEWISALDGDVCMACAIQHGTIHPLTERMNSHFCCRCISVPILIGQADRDQLGTEWFGGLTEEKQRAMMGGKAFDAWKDGKINLTDMVGTQHNDIYGEMLSVRSITDLLGD